ncbi:MAG: hypothetical protein AAFX06_28795 [Planctomycetota bacterium]
MYVNVSNHAKQRFDERFGGWVYIPFDKIRRAARLMDKGDQFRVSQPLATFVCKRTSRRNALIVTVLFSLN